MVGGVVCCSLYGVWVMASAYGADASPVAVTARVPWTTSNFVGSPDPPAPYAVPNAFPGIKFDHPLYVRGAPGTDRLFVCEQGGRIYSFVPRPDAGKPDLVFDLRADWKKLAPLAGAVKPEAVYGLAFHPKFGENRQCFVCYTLQGKGPNLENGTRVSRFRMTAANPPRLDPASEEVVLSFLQGGHNGGDLHFGPDGCLYITTGDATDPSPPDKFHTGQDITDLLSSVLRIDVDRKDPGRNYAVPKDNPFVGHKVRGKDARPEVWAYGFRNPWRMSFDRKTGDLWLGDVGWELWEMVHKVEKGGNYGWSLVEGRQAVNAAEVPGPTPVRPPVIELPHTIAGSVTGGYVYRGKKHPDLVGAYVFGDWVTRKLWAARVDGARLVSMTELTDPSVRIVSFGEDADGELLLVDYDTGTLHTLEKAPATTAAADFPRTLSASGLFAATRDHAPAPGVVRFAPAARQWQDGAAGEHLLALPGTSAIADHFEQKKPLPGHVDWMSFRLHYPRGAVLAKTLTLETDPGHPATRRRVETQVLHWDGTNWRPYTYAWRDDQTDADLVPADGADKVILVRDAAAAGGQRDRVWAFGSRTQCLQCHSPWAEYTLAFNPGQLAGGHGGRGQFAHFADQGLVQRVGRDGKPKPPPAPAEAARGFRLADPADASRPAADRARSYLHANCAHCHRNGGGGAVEMQLVGSDPLRALKLIDVVPSRGTFDLPDARLVAAGDPARSVLLYRMAKVGAGRMPHMGSEMVDPAGVGLVAEWVRSLPGGTPADPVPTDWPAVAATMTSPRSALGLALALHRGQLPPEVRGRLVKTATGLPPGGARDLLEPFLPPPTGERKLGQNPRPQSILAAAGDAGRGRALFAAQGLQCATCHKVDGSGGEVGPDLSKVGGQRSRDDLLDSLLDPSRRVEPGYQTFVVRTADGRAVTGLLAKRDAAEVVVKDAQGKVVRIPAADVELVTQARESLMPANLLADLTARQAADLLAFLAARK